MSEIWKIHRPSGILVSEKGRIETYIGGTRKTETFGSYHKATKYRKTQRNGIAYWVHRLVLETFKPNKYPWLYDRCDHIDRNRANNDVKNLRWSNGTLNGLNNDAKNVFPKPSGNWVARLGLYNKDFHLGTYPTEQEAKEVVARAKEAAFEIIEY